jgi:FAD/FMN-containing dehydrogenase
MHAAATPSAESFLAKARSLLGQAAVKTAPHELAPFSTDWRKRYHGVPLAVVLPATTAEVATVVQLANEFKIALVPQGGNTGLSGGATPDTSGQQVIVCLSRLTAIRQKDITNKTITVEAGVTLQQVQALAQDMGLFFPLSIGSKGSATIGGNLATNAGGTGVLRYGNARDLCLGLEVVTATGDIWNGLRGLRKDNTGYDLKDLFVGSEGSLGLITAAVLKLFPQPKGVVTALAQVTGPANALRLLDIAQAHADAALTGFEFMSAQSTQLVQDYFPEIARHGEPMISTDTVLLEISHAQSEAGAAQLLETIMEKALAVGAIENATVAQSMAQSNALWHLRESITLASAEDGPQVKHDISLPISGLPDFIAAMEKELLAAHPNIRLINFGHFGDGNLHFNVAPPACDLDRDQRHQHHADFLSAHEDAIRRRVHDRVVAMGGSISAEHGLGQLRRAEAAHYKSPVEMQLMKSIKAALDPHGLMNPGKVL